MIAARYPALARFLAYYRPHKGLFMLDFSCAVMSGLLELSFPLAVRGFIDILLPTGQWLWIAAASAALLVIYILNTALMAVVTYWGHKLGVNIETEMRRKAFDHLQKLSFGYFDNQRTGHLVGRLTKDLEEIGEVAHHGPEDLFVAVMTLVGAFALMYAVKPELAIVAGITVPLIAWVTAHYGTRMSSTWRGIYGRVGDFNARIEENVGGIRVVQAFVNEDHERRLFAGDNRRYGEAKMSAYRIMTASASLNYLGMRLIQMIVLTTGSFFVLRGQLSSGGFVAFLLLVGVFFRPIEKINAVMENYPKGIAGFRRYVGFLDTKPDIADRPGARPAPALRGAIRYSGVTFGYSPGREVLRGLDLELAAGETLALVGPSGGGKTTICSLLPRFYEVGAGAITIDGIDIRDMTLKSLRGQIGIVQQDVFLFAGSVRENIAYGRLDASGDEIWEAARRARLDGVIAALPEGLDTLIGERGVKLSGGQKQRLAIARMFLKNPPILILDEATSALDTETERAIQSALEELSRGRATLVIAHRLATIVHADRIAVVDGGRIVEQGRHGELLARPGAYRRLNEAQFGSRAS